jgi:DNA-binding NarL/FixJ family response regulator
VVDGCPFPTDRRPSPGGTPHVVVVEDREVTREGLRIVLATDGRFVVSAACGDCTSALAATARCGADVAVVGLDLRSESGDGFEVCHVLRTRRRLPVVAVTASADPLVAERARALGASACVVQRASAADLAATVWSVAAGRPPRRFVVDAHHSVDDDLRRLTAARLTARQVEVMSLVGDGLSNRAIAERLGISMATAKNHIHDAMTKLGFTRRTEAVAMVNRMRVRSGFDDGWT